jgi:hypothetical protein
VVGNSSFNIVQPDVGVASSIQIKKKSESYDAMYYTYPTNRVSIGSITKPLIDNVQKYFLTSGETGEFKLNKRELDEFISLGEFPVINKSNIYWVEDNSGEI